MKSCTLLNTSRVSKIVSLRSTLYSQNWRMAVSGLYCLKKNSVGFMLQDMFNLEMTRDIFRNCHQIHWLASIHIWYLMVCKLLSRNIEKMKLNHRLSFPWCVDEWATLEKQIYLDGHKLMAVNQNLIDLLWESDRPAVVSNPAKVLEFKYTGKNCYLYY